MMDEKALIRLSLRSRELYRWELRQGRVNVDLKASPLRLRFPETSELPGI